MAVIRRAIEADIPAVLALWLEAGPAPSITDTPQGVGALLARDPDALLVADDEGRVVGTVVATFDGWRCYLYRMAVAASHRRRGIGRALVAAAEDRLRSLGALRVDALVLDDDEQAHAYWRRLGFEPHLYLRRWGHRL